MFQLSSWGSRIFDMRMVAGRIQIRRTGAIPAILAALVLMACDVVDPGPPPPDLRMSAEATLVDDVLNVMVTVRNEADTTIQLAWFACDQLYGVAVRAYPVPPGDGQPVWDERRRELGVCYPLAYSLEVEPGGEVSHGHWVPAMVILGDSLPGGLYRLTATPHYRDLLDWDVEVELGEFSLSAPDDVGR